MRIIVFVFGILFLWENALASSVVPGEFIVTLKPGSSLNISSNIIETISESHRIYLVKRNVLERSQFSLRALQRHPAVLDAEPNAIYETKKKPNDPNFVLQWGASNDGKMMGRVGVDINLPAAWKITTGDRRVVVAVLDTGVDYRHPDLKQNIWTNNRELRGRRGVDDDGNGYVDDYFGYDFIDNDSNPMDQVGHGTHVAGIIAAKGNNGIGVAGVAWNSRIMILRTHNAQGKSTTASLVRALEYATRMGARITNNSWGGVEASRAVMTAIARARARNIIFVAAAGNEGVNMDRTRIFPATYPLDNILSVTAVNDQGRLPKFANYSARYADIAAPGVNIVSTYPGNDYRGSEGTSMAAPFVSGVAALVISRYPRATYKQVIHRILTTARKTQSLRGKVRTAGIVDAHAALTGQMRLPELGPGTF